MLDSWEISWPIAVVVAIALVALVVVIWLVLRWRRERAAAPPRQSQPSLAGQLAGAWTWFYRALPPRARHFPTVIVMGDAGTGKSHVIDSRVDWRGQANQFLPSASDTPVLQLYLGRDVVVHELSVPLLRDITPAVRRALARLWRRIGPSVVVVVVVDARAVATTPPNVLRELGQLVRGKIRALPARCRGRVEVRLCLTHLDQFPGYTDFVSVLGADPDPLDIAALAAAPANDRAWREAADELIAKYEPNLAYGLGDLSIEAFAQLLEFYAAFPALLTQLAPLPCALAGDGLDEVRYRFSGLYLGSSDRDRHIGDPFVVNRGAIGVSIDEHRRFHRRASALTAAAGMALVAALMAWHAASVNAVEHAVTVYGERQAAHDADESHVRRVVGELARMQRGERLWLGHAFVERKRVLGERFAKALRDQYLLPKLHAERINRATMLYVVALIYASDRRGMRALIREHIPSWATKLDLTSTVIEAYLDVSRDPYQVAEQFDPEYTGSDWPGYVFDRIKPLYDKPRVTQADLDSLDQDPPQLYDEREYAVRRQIVDKLSSQLALATHPPITKLLESPLGASDWVEANIGPLRGIHDAIAVHKLAPTSPSTLGDLAADLERMLGAPPGHGPVFEVKRRKNAGDERFVFDVAAWKRKLAASSASATIAGVNARGLANPAQAIGFFSDDAAPHDVGLGSPGQGAGIALPGKYTAAAFRQHVAPALDFITGRAGKLGLGDEDAAALEALLRDAITAYAGRYAAALHDYYNSFRFEPGSESVLRFALAGVAQPSSWFFQFAATPSFISAARTLRPVGLMRSPMT
ncbi:MAG TPA: hypothetical protein VLM79_31085, partial [Kofleriaceae bacterium]|nr:hypothetical protein [Kofleriaceae bacterium]